MRQLLKARRQCRDYRQQAADSRLDAAVAMHTLNLQYRKHLLLCLGGAAAGGVALSGLEPHWRPHAHAARAAWRFAIPLLHGLL